MSLKEYKKKRKFNGTPEPKGKVEKDNKNRFVVHDHQAKRAGHHHDLRLEMDGILKSWAVPKGVPKEKRTKHLAMATEDHPISYINFEGEIPEGNYGAGKVEILDKGKYELIEKKKDEIVFKLKGKKLKGTYVLIRFKKAGEDHWLLFKTD